MAISAKYGHGYDTAYRTIADSLSHQDDAVCVGKIEEHLVSDRQLAAEMGNLLQDAVHVPAQAKANWTTRLDKILLHPVFGLPIFFAAMF